MQRKMEINEVPRITCEELKQLIDKGENVVIIDTRKSSGYNAEHIKGAINIYYNPAGYQMEREMDSRWVSEKRCTGRSFE